MKTLRDNIRRALRMECKADFARLFKFPKPAVLATSLCRAEIAKNPRVKYPSIGADAAALDLTHGTIGFRTGTPKLALLSRAWNWAKSLAAVDLALPGFVRVASEIDKEAILAQRDNPSVTTLLPACGLKIVQDETFFVEPKIDEIQLTEKKQAA